MGTGVTAVLLITVIASGLFDPKPMGEKLWTQTNLLQTVFAQEPQITWLPDELPSGNFTIRATVAHQSGEPDSAAGIVLGNECANVIIAIAPLGYATIQQTPAHTENCPPITDYHLPITEMPWQPWPHVHSGEEPNEIWIDVEEGQMQVRLNRELLWVGDAPIQPTQLGLYGESFGETTVYQFPHITLYTSTNEGPED